MINESEYCVFYYDKHYIPPKRKLFKKSVFNYQPKLGTAISFEYAYGKKKNIKNVKIL